MTYDLRPIAPRAPAVQIVHAMAGFTILATWTMVGSLLAALAVTLARLRQRLVAPGRHGHPITGSE
ncbi:MAG TPA: hypothetical protein VKW76_01325 [Candidatus Binatia bacterium]|nr:hypothetical protein [Candidatus Binatia bacterium]